MLLELGNPFTFSDVYSKTMENPSSPNAKTTNDNPFSQSADSDDLAGAFSEHYSRLERMIEFRLDPRLRNRVDPADILQDTFIEAQRRLPGFLENRAVSMFVWIRQLTLQRLIDVHRSHFRDKRSVSQEVRLDRAAPNAATSMLIANELVGEVSTPSRQLSRKEDIQRLQLAIDRMDPIDQEVLALRHFEQLGNKEVAEILEIGVTAASNRYVRAMARLAEIMSSVEATTQGTDQ